MKTINYSISKNIKLFQLKTKQNDKKCNFNFLKLFLQSNLDQTKVNTSLILKF